ncbi:MAG: ribonuclease E activity regulator RraA [Deinococcales bacterium]
MFYTSDLCDAYSDKVGVAEPIFRHFGAKHGFFGPIRTVKCFEDNSLVKAALEDIEVGEVLVVDGGGSSRCALLGDNLATIAQERNLGGIVVYGYVRDSQELAKIPVGILALGTNPRRSVKRGEGQRDISLKFAGLKFEKGHYLYADSDGLIVSPTALS